MTWQLTFINGRWQRGFVPQLAHALPPFVFDQQRATCEACAHLERVTSVTGDQELLCFIEGSGRRGSSFHRHSGQACGPEALNFQPIRRPDGQV